MRTDVRLVETVVMLGIVATVAGTLIYAGLRFYAFASDLGSALAGILG